MVLVGKTQDLIRIGNAGEVQAAAYTKELHAHRTAGGVVVHRADRIPGQADGTRERAALVQGDVDGVCLGIVL
jgi:hypothetical protein